MSSAPQDDLPLTPLLLEMFCWTVGYIVLVENVMIGAVIRATQTFFPKAWADLEKNDGAFAKNEQEEFPLMLGIGAQHVFSGCLVLWGALSGDPSFAAHGILCEAGWELKDALCLLFGIYPYKGDTVKPALRGIIIFHHLPGLLTAVPIISNNIHHNIHVLYIAASMILAGGLGVFINAVVSLFNQYKRTVYFVKSIEFCIFVVCRFVIFPSQSYYLLANMYEKEEFFVAGLICCGVVFMMIFNILIVQIKTKKMMTEGRALRSARLKMQKQSSFSAVVPIKLEDNVARLLKQQSSSSFITGGE